MLYWLENTANYEWLSISWVAILNHGILAVGSNSASDYYPTKSSAMVYGLLSTNEYDSVAMLQNSQISDDSEPVKHIEPQFMHICTFAVFVHFASGFSNRFYKQVFLVWQLSVHHRLWIQFECAALGLMLKVWLSKRGFPVQPDSLLSFVSESEEE